MAYLKCYLPPHANLITMVKLVGKAFPLKLDSVFFSPGTGALDDAARTYLDRVTALMRDRTKIRIRLCGKAVPTDGLGGEDSARALAETRTATIKDHLVTSQRTATERLFICRPAIDDRADARRSHAIAGYLTDGTTDALAKQRVGRTVEECNG